MCVAHSQFAMKTHVWVCMEQEGVGARDGLRARGCVVVTGLAHQGAIHCCHVHTQANAPLCNWHRASQVFHGRDVHACWRQAGKTSTCTRRARLTAHTISVRLRQRFLMLPTCTCKNYWHLPSGPAAVQYIHWHKTTWPV